VFVLMPETALQRDEGVEVKQLPTMASTADATTQVFSTFGSADCSTFSGPS
jgi:hypothetical protein